jgi:hypothetical protein
VHLVIPKISPLCHEPRLLYGYESHTPELFEARLEKKRRLTNALLPKGEAVTPARLERIMGQAGLDVAAELRKTHDPGLAKAIAEMTDEAPAWLPVLGKVDV